MKPIKVRKGPSEHDIQEAIRRALHDAGWTIVEKTHGNAFQPGWPDLYAFHPCHDFDDEGYQCLPTTRWIEVKKPGGTLTPAQKDRFKRWEEGGLGVWVMAHVDLSILEGPSNWREWL